MQLSQMRRTHTVEHHTAIGRLKLLAITRTAATGPPPEEEQRRPISAKPDLVVSDHGAAWNAKNIALAELAL